MHGVSQGIAGVAADLLIPICADFAIPGMADGQPANALTIGASVSASASVAPVIHFANGASRLIEVEPITPHAT